MNAGPEHDGDSHHTRSEGDYSESLQRTKEQERPLGIRGCGNCGIQILQPGEFCPLCGGPLEDTSEDVNAPLQSPREPLREDRVFPNPSGQQDFSLGRSLVSRIPYALVVWGILLIPALVVLIIDGQMTGMWSWSRYVHLSLGFLALGVGGSILAGSRAWVHIVVWYAACTGFVLLLDGLTPLHGWARGIAVPVISMAFAGIGLLSILVRALHPGGLGVLSGLSVILSLFCIGVELQLYLYFQLAAALVWSPIVAAVLLPLGLILGIIRRLMHNSSRVQRFFHW